MKNVLAEMAEILVDHSTGDVGIRFDDGDTFVLTPKSAASLGRGLVDCATSITRPRAATPSHARWAAAE